MNREYVNIFKALSDPNRLRIVKMLAERELCMCEIREVLDLSNSTVSKHLTILRDAGLLLDTKDGKWVNFRLNDKSGPGSIRSLIGLIRKSFDDDEAIRKDAVKLRRVNRRHICNIKS
ncbi:MAG: ArsR family transcriptional regulator [Ignavibacteriae bacterium]|nr:MAG: ArsR family transcriptional regulator [Ignavibacteriota bacterium]